MHCNSFKWSINCFCFIHEQTRHTDHTTYSCQLVVDGVLAMMKNEVYSALFKCNLQSPCGDVQTLRTDTLSARLNCGNKWTTFTRHAATIVSNGSLCSRLAANSIRCNLAHSSDEQLNDGNYKPQINHCDQDWHRRKWLLLLLLWCM